MNPGLQPTKDYFNIPVLGSFNMSASSNVLGMSDIIDLVGSWSDLGIAGSGFGLDLGASYKVGDNLTVSASILDWGFLKWKESETTVATVTRVDDVTIDATNYDR